MDIQMETAQLLARFKLAVKRSLGETVDLEQLTRSPDYARQRLAEIEEAATDENLIVMVLRLREILLPATKTQKKAAEPAASKPETSETRNYRLGARAW